MKILHVITSLRTGGAEKLMVDLLPRLKEYRHDVDLLLFDGTDTPFRREAEKKGLNVFELGHGGLMYSPIKLLKLIPYLRKYDLVHTHNTAPQLFVALMSLFSHVRIITTEHGGSNRRRSIPGFKIVDRWMYRRYDKVICIADKTKENLVGYLGGVWTNILTINNGVDIDKFASAQASPDLEKIAPGSRKIIMVAGFRWEKDQDTLIRAMRDLPDKFHLFLVGNGVRRRELEFLCDDLSVSNRVHFLGIRSDIPQLLHAADYIVMSSHFEGLSLSSVEGMSAGKPFLASDVDGLREVVNGAGILFPHQNSETLAREIISLASSPQKYKAIAETCSRRSLYYDISTMAAAYARCYDEILNK